MTTKTFSVWDLLFQILLYEISVFSLVLNLEVRSRKIVIRLNFEHLDQHGES